MLVLARREGETLELPDLDVVLEVLAIKGSVIRVGVTAPSNIKVLRGELIKSRRKLASMLGNATANASPKNQLAIGRGSQISGGNEERSETNPEFMHRIRNWLHTTQLRMQLIRRYLEADRLEEATGMIQKVLNDFRTIENGTPHTQAVDNYDVEISTLPGGTRTRRALLVEDNANERQLLAGFLRTSGFQVETAGDGAAALDYLSSHEQPDVVLLDMVIPKGDGPTVLRKIRESRTFGQLKVFAVSGTSPSNWNIATGPKGVDRWFEKPVDPQVLVREITQELDRPRAK